MCNPIKPTKPSPVQCSSSSDQFIVPTVFEKPTVQINLRNLDSSAVASLKKKDPFMYYSIKEVRSAAVLNRNLDTSIFDVPAAVAAGPRPNKKQRQADDGRVITRKSRVSFEVHGDLLFEDFINELTTNAAPRIEAMDPDVGDVDYFAMLAEFDRQK